MPGKAGSRQSGIGLIEILVAVIILSIGFLATGRMQVEGIRSSQEAYFRSQAASLAKDMADRMRSNPAGVEAGFYDGLSTTQGIQPSSCIAAGSNTACTPAMVTQNDLAEWTAFFNNTSADFIPLLPSSATIPASASITLAGNIYTISVVWSEPVDGTDTAQTYSIRLVP